MEETLLPLEYTLVNSEETLYPFLDVMDKVKEFYMDLYMDEEGSSDHGRHSPSNAITLKMRSLDRNWLLDPIALGQALFDTPGRIGRKRSLRQILESKNIPIGMFDGR